MKKTKQPSGSLDYRNLLALVVFLATILLGTSGEALENKENHPIHPSQIPPSPDTDVEFVDAVRLAHV